MVISVAQWKRRRVKGYKNSGDGGGRLGMNGREEVVKIGVVR